MGGGAPPTLVHPQDAAPGGGGAAGGSADPMLRLLQEHAWLPCPKGVQSKLVRWSRVA